MLFKYAFDNKVTTTLRLKSIRKLKIHYPSLIIDPVKHDFMFANQIGPPPSFKKRTSLNFVF